MTYFVASINRWPTLRHQQKWWPTLQHQQNRWPTLQHQQNQWPNLWHHCFSIANWKTILHLCKHAIMCQNQHGSGTIWHVLRDRIISICNRTFTWGVFAEISLDSLVPASRDLFGNLFDIPPCSLAREALLLVWWSTDGWARRWLWSVSLCRRQAAWQSSP